MKLVHSEREKVKGWQCRCGSLCACCCICSNPDWDAQFGEHMASLQEAIEDMLEEIGLAEAETGMSYPEIRWHLIGQS